MRIIDISGSIYEDMWNFGFPHGKFRILNLDFEFLGERYYHQGFEGLVGSTGTYIETNAALQGIEKGMVINKIPLDRLVNLDAYVLQVPLKNLNESHERKYISIHDIKKAEKELIPENKGIIVSTGYGRNWHKKNFIEKSPFFKRDALFYLLNKKPHIIASDFPSWENKSKPENTHSRLFSSDTIVMPNCVNLESIEKYKVKLTVLPLNILDISMCPVRAVVIEE